MKKIFLFIFISITTFSQSQGKDTIFLLKGKQANKGNKIYIQQNISTDNYNSLIDFSKISKIKKENKLNINLVERWIPLYLYKKKYYTYMPCDLGTYSRVFLSEKEIVFEGFELINYKLNSKIIYLDKNNYKFSYTNNFKKKVWVSVKIINKNKGIAIFKYSNGINNTYQLMVDANKIKSFPIIVNECNEGKAEEFEFDTPNFKKLLKNHI